MYMTPRNSYTEGQVRFSNLSDETIEKIKSAIFDIQYAVNEESHIYEFQMYPKRSFLLTAEQLGDLIVQNDKTVDPNHLDGGRLNFYYLDDKRFAQRLEEGYLEISFHNDKGVVKTVIQSHHNYKSCQFTSVFPEDKNETFQFGTIEQAQDSIERLSEYYDLNSKLYFMMNRFDDVLTEENFPTDERFLSFMKKHITSKTELTLKELVVLFEDELTLDVFNIQNEPSQQLINTINYKTGHIEVHDQYFKMHKYGTYTACKHYLEDYLFGLAETSESELEEALSYMEQEDTEGKYIFHADVWYEPSKDNKYIAEIGEPYSGEDDDAFLYAYVTMEFTLD